MKTFWITSSLFIFYTSAAQKQPVDLLVYNATIYTVDDHFSNAEAMAVNKGKIVAVGEKEDLSKRFDARKKINASGKFIYPGFIDAHAHFVEYSIGLQTADLTGLPSWEVVIERLVSFSQTHKTGWLLGRGWDQNRWSVKEFPSKERLDQLFPDRPVFLSRVDGHAAIANQKALDLAGVKAGTTIKGGIIETKQGKLTGILVDNATRLVGSIIPDPSPSQLENDLMEGQNNCFAFGLTTVDDCGLNYETVQLLDGLQRKGQLKMRLYAMLSDALKNYEFAAAHGKIKTDHLHVCAFKVYADGALGSRGACLLAPYSDKPGWTGFLLSSQQHFDSVARIIAQMGFQMCTHAIGDSANRVMLTIYQKYLKGKNDLRWRIEHAQVVNENDFVLFGNNNIIPSVQPTHATSDMYWAMDRLGNERIKGAYAYKQLLNENGWIALGTDFPVEDISPFKTFYAAVFREDKKGFPPHGFQTENALSRIEALKGMTIWAAKANFEEKEKGSLEAGKFADFVILDQDIMKVPPTSFFNTKVIMTVLNGQIVYQKKTTK